MSFTTTTSSLLLLFFMGNSFCSLVPSLTYLQLHLYLTTPMVLTTATLELHYYSAICRTPLLAMECCCRRLDHKLGVPVAKINPKGIGV